MIAKGHDSDLTFAAHSEGISRLVGKAILEAYDFDEDNTSVLDYACGVGAVSLHSQSETSD